MNDFFAWSHDISGRILLPLVIAFGLGVAVALEVTHTEVEHWRGIYTRAVADIEHARIACGAQPDPDLVAHQLASAIQQVQP